MQECYKWWYEMTGKEIMIIKHTCNRNGEPYESTLVTLSPFFLLFCAQDSNPSFPVEKQQ